MTRWAQRLGAIDSPSLQFVRPSRIEFAPQGRSPKRPLVDARQYRHQQHQRRVAGDLDQHAVKARRRRAVLRMASDPCRRAIDMPKVADGSNGNAAGAAPPTCGRAPAPARSRARSAGHARPASPCSRAIRPDGRSDGRVRDSGFGGRASRRRWRWSRPGMPPSTCPRPPGLARSRRRHFASTTNGMPARRRRACNPHWPLSSHSAATSAETVPA